MHRLILTLALLAGSAHAALRGGTGPTMPTIPMPTNPVPPVTGGGSPATFCPSYPEVACTK